MPSTDFISQFKVLSYNEQRNLLKGLQAALTEARPILEHRTLEACPYCNNTKLYKHGIYKNGSSRFKCRECNKTFNELTGTSIHRIHKKSLWDGFIRLMLQSKTIREIVSELGIARQTALNWRHKVLSAFNSFFTKKFKGVKGSKNALKTSKRNLRGISNDQVSVMVTSDRYGSIDLKVIKRGRITKDALVEKLDLTRFNRENIIYSDNSRIIKNLFSELNIKHKTFIAKNTYNGEVHVQNVNNLTRRLKDWIKLHFNNVSTKYLHNYLNWFTMLEIMKGENNAEDNFWTSMLKTDKAYNQYKNIQENY